MKRKSTDKQKIIKLEKQLKAKDKEIKRIKNKLAKKSVGVALQYRQKGYTWKKIGKKLGVSESSIRHRTQRHCTNRQTGEINAVLKGRTTKEKQDGIAIMHERVAALLKSRGQPHVRADVMDYVQSHRS